MTKISGLAGRVSPTNHNNQVRLQDRREEGRQASGAPWAHQVFKRDDSGVNRGAEKEAIAWCARKAVQAKAKVGTMAKVTRIKVSKRRLGYA